MGLIKSEENGEAASAPAPEEKDEYGTNAQPAFTDMIHLMNLPSDYLPQTGKHRKPNRLIIVGDVHGMKGALLDLLAKVDFNEKHDHLILAGDMISKGPNSAGVVDLAMRLGASGVRGNHEDRIILAHADMVQEHMETSMDAPGPSEDPEKKVDGLEEVSFSHGDYKDRALVRELGEKRIKWLKKCPVILRVGHLEGMEEVVVVHAGLAPGVELEKQDPTMVMNMRTIVDGVPSEGREGTAWTKVWNKHQKSLPKKERTTVIYGHDSKKGLQLNKYSMGIDTGCLKGGKLTAVVIEGGHSQNKHKVVHVNCKDGRKD
ncbi:ser thr phosphatase family protein [Rutstroemia sp. NJR-2017a WRK4]|nr:ser thr phosphatase family protein [Rutstroemia sp. NJR-2017a WRK4]